MGTASIIVGSFLFFGQTQAHAEEFERVTTGTVDTGGQPARADQGQEGPRRRGYAQYSKSTWCLQVKMHQMKIMLVTKMLQLHIRLIRK